MVSAWCITTRDIGENSKIILGVVEKTVRMSQGSLVHVLFHEKGLEATRTLFTRLQCIVNYWLSTMASHRNWGHNRRQGNNEFRQQEDCKLIQQAQRDGLKPSPSMTIHESFESRWNLNQYEASQIIILNARINRKQPAC